MHKTLTSKTALSFFSLSVFMAACSGGGMPGGTGGTVSVSGGAPNGSGGAPNGSGGAPASGGVTGNSGGAPNAGGTVGSGGAGASSSGGGGPTSGGAPGSGGSVSSICPYTLPEDPATFPENWTAGEVTQFNANGGWTWYNDERVLVDAEGGKIIVGSAASSASSQSQNTNIEIVIHDLATGANDKKSLGTLSYSDDHNNPGIVVKAPGEYFAAYTHHNADCTTRWSNYSGGSWAATANYTWSPCTPDNGGTNGTNTVTYNNVWQLSSEGTIYNFIRATETNMWFLYSEDDGASWNLGGRITASPQVGYNAGYYKFWGNGVDRIDFFATESHPRDSNTSVYHGYIQGGKSYDSLGAEIDDDIFDDQAPLITDFTTVFQAGGQLGGVTMHRLWNFDVTRYEDGTVAVLWQGRETQCPHDQKDTCTMPGHHVAYSRFDGTTWTSTRLVKGGRTLYRNKSDWWEEDYLGGAALDPDHPEVVYVSTNIDPRDDTTDHGVNEIWKGVTCDSGATFSWTPMTMNSQNENLRPTMPKWDANNSALLWFRGNYQTAQMYSAEVVGIVTQAE
jgi:hypothetical protein